jgi:hypothetical protein
MARVVGIGAEAGSAPCSRLARRQLRRLGHRGGRFQAPGWALLLVGVNATLALLWLVLLLRVTLIAP